MSNPQTSQPEHPEGKQLFWGFFFRNFRVTIVILFAILVGGIFALTYMPLESDPEVQVPIAIVTTAYPGATATDVEKLVTDRLEAGLKSLTDLEEITSSSKANVSSVTVEFDPESDLTEAIRTLRDEVTIIKNDLPADANDPIVTEINAGDYPILTISLLSNLPMRELKIFGEELQDELESLPGVSEVILSGIPPEEFQVLIKRQDLAGLELNLNHIISTLAANNLDSSVGLLLTNNFYYQVSLKGQLQTVEDLKNLSIANRDGQNILLGEIAEIRKTFAEKLSNARVYLAESQNYREALTLQIKKKTGANIDNLVRAAKKRTTEFQAAKLPEAVEVLFTNDWSEYIREDVATLGRSALVTAGIIFVLLFLALGFWEAFLVGLGIPFIFLTAFIGLALLGETLNSIVLFALILSLGLIVDTSIVIMEGLHANLKKGLTVKAAALAAIKTYHAPLISGTLTTISAFVPMLLMSGLMGEFVKHVPITIIFTLGASLFVALLLLPAVAAHLLTPQVHQTALFWRIILAPLTLLRILCQKIFAFPHQIFQRIIAYLRQIYQRRLKKILHSRAQKITLTLATLLAFMVVLSFPLPGVGVLKVGMFPPIDFDYFNVTIELPVGSPLSETQRVTAKVEKILEETQELQNFVTILGGGALGITGHGQHNSGGRTKTNEAALTVTLTKMDQREIKSYEIAETMRAKLNHLTEAKIEVEELKAGPPSGAPIEIRIIGQEFKILEKSAQKIATVLAEIPGTRDVAIDLEYDTGEFHFQPKKERLGYYGLTVSEVAGFLRTAVFGDDSVKVLDNGEETPIRVALDFRDPACTNKVTNQLQELRDEVTICPNTPTKITELLEILIPTARGQVLLSELVDFDLQPVMATIRHHDTENVVYVRAYNEYQVTPNTIIQALTAKIPALNLPAEIKLSFGGETEETTESYQSLFHALIVGVLLITLILVFQFNSFRQPVIILLTLPLALIGVFGGLALLGRNFSFPGFIGIVALAGIVVNDAIVLIDRINFNWRTNGLRKEAAILLAADERFQPIILTTITTAAGVLPLAFTNELWGDLAWTLALGIVFASFLMLFIVPIFYLDLEKKERE